MTSPPRSALLAVALLAAAAVLLGTPGERAEAHHLCGATGSPLGPFTITTYEAADYKTTYARTLDLASFNDLFPELPTFALPKVESGNRSVGSSQTADGYIPPVLLKAIAYNESSWAQASFSPLVDYGEVGPVLSSHDCGYGIMQVTTGMQNVTGAPNLDQAMIGTHYAFNIARGARILMDKWNMSPEFRPIIGDRDPNLIENWYYAIWGYNGWAFQNHPLNPAYSAGRAAFSCGPTSDGLGHDRSQYPYQEIILGCAANPPFKGGARLWEPQAVHLPELTNAAFSDPMKIENWNPCAYSSQCTAMDIPTPNTSHRDPTGATLTRESVIGLPTINLSRDSIEVTIPPGGTSAQAIVTVSNAGTGLLGFRTTTSASWLKVSPGASVALGNDLGGQSRDVTITLNASGLAQGIHRGQVKIESLYGGTRTVAITLNNGIPDGSLVKGSGPDVYLVRLGVKRHLIDLANFVARGYSFSNVKGVTDGYLASVPTGQPVLDLFATGGLIKGSAPDVYVMENGVKRHATSAERFLACDYNWDAIVVVPDWLLGTLPSGSGLDGTQCPRRGFVDGTLLEGPSAGVWVMEGGKRRWAVSEDMFLSCGHQWGNVNLVANSIIAAIPQGAPLAGCYPDGTLLRGAAPDVFVVYRGVKRHVVDLANFSARGYSFSSVKDVPNGFLNTVPTGQPLLDLFATGGLIKGTAPDVYVMEAGLKRHVVSAEKFGSCGYGWDAILVVDNSLLASITTASPLAGSQCPKPGFVNGTLLEGSVAGVWVVEGGKRRWAVSAEVFLGCGYVWGNVNQVADSTIAGIPVGSPLSPC